MKAAIDIVALATIATVLALLWAIIIAVLTGRMR